MTCQRGTSSTKTGQGCTSSTKTAPDGTSSIKTVQDGTSSTKTFQDGTSSTKTDEDQAPKVIQGRKMVYILTGMSVLETGVLDAARDAELIRGRDI